MNKPHAPSPTLPLPASADKRPPHTISTAVCLYNCESLARLFLQGFHADCKLPLTYPLRERRALQSGEKASTVSLPNDSAEGIMARGGRGGSCAAESPYLASSSTIWRVNSVALGVASVCGRAGAIAACTLRTWGWAPLSPAVNHANRDKI